MKKQKPQAIIPVPIRKPGPWRLSPFPGPPGLPLPDQSHETPAGYDFGTILCISDYVGISHVRPADRNQAGPEKRIQIQDRHAKRRFYHVSV